MTPNTANATCRSTLNSDAALYIIDIYIQHIILYSIIECLVCFIFGCFTKLNASPKESAPLFRQI